MVLKLLIFSIIAAVCSAELVPVSNYVGKHSFKCDYGNAITGARVDDKLYTFGGCYALPYVIDPNDEEYAYSMVPRRLRSNVSNTIEIYDIQNDEWTIEADVKIPFALKRARTYTYKKDIYFHDISGYGAVTFSGRMWKYDTEEKKWSKPDELPFVWHGSLLSCEMDDKIYFTGANDGHIRNIIQVYNSVSEEWEKPIFLNKKITGMQEMLCGKTHIYFLGTEENEEEEDNDEPRVYHFGSQIFYSTFDLISAEYETGNTFLHGNFTGQFGKVSVKDESFYVLDIEQRNSTISKIDTVTKKKITLGSFPHTLKEPLLIPYKNDEVFLFGGGIEKSFPRSKNDDNRNTIKTYNHKLIPEQEKERLILQE